MTIPLKHSEFLFQFFEGERSVSELEEWVYSNEELENLIGKEDFTDLISIDYTKNQAPYEAEKVLRKHMDHNEFIIFNLKKIIKKIIAKSPDVERYILRTYELYCRGYQFLDKLGMDYGLVIASPPPYTQAWQDLSHEDRRAIVDEFYPEIREHAERTLNFLNQRKFDFTDSKVGNFLEPLPYPPQYNDQRSLSEKQSTQTNRIVIESNAHPHPHPKLWRKTLQNILNLFKK